MLNVLRHKGVSRKILWVVTTIIILSFAVFGSAWRLDNTLNVAGRMYGKTVSFRDFEKAYLDTKDEAIRTFGDQFFKYGSRMDLEGQSWDRLILLREVKNRGIKTSDQEVIDYIGTLPYFLTNGKFDQSKYEMIVKNPQVFGRKTTDFEEGIRTQLSIRKLLEQITGKQELTDAELKKQYTLKTEKLKLSYALLDPLTAAKDVTLTDEDIKNYFSSNKEQFRTQPMVNVAYIAINYPAKADDKQKAEIKKLANDIEKELKTNPDLKAVASKFKVEMKESGFFTHAQPLLTFAWNPELVDKIFSMKKDELSPALESPDGYQIIKLVERKEPQIPEFDSIKNDVKNALLTNKGFAIALEKANSLMKNIQAGLTTNKSFKDIVKVNGYKAEETPLFGRGEFIANMGLIAEFQEAASKLNMQNRLSDVISSSQGPAIIYLEEVQGIDEKQYEAEKESFKQQMLAQERNQKIVSFITKLRIDAKIENLLNKKK